jgi:hypothetical protein
MPSRAFTSWIFDSVLLVEEPALLAVGVRGVAMTTTGRFSSIRALGPCFISPAG